MLWYTKCGQWLQVISCNKQNTQFSGSEVAMHWRSLSKNFWFADSSKLTAHIWVGAIFGAYILFTSPKCIFSAVSHWLKFYFNEVAVLFCDTAAVLRVTSAHQVVASISAEVFIISAVCRVCSSWISHLSPWRMASVMPDLRLPSQSRGITAL